MSPSPSTADRAASVIQAWYRSRQACTRAHRLLLWLHLTHLEHQREVAACEAEHTAVHTPAAAASSEGTSHSKASEAPVLSRLVAAVVYYEAAVSAENFTRALLVEELQRSSTAVQAASPEARHRLQWQHPALRRRSLSVEVAQGARCAMDISAPSTATASVVDVLQAVEAYLSCEYFAWWRRPVESSTDKFQRAPSQRRVMGGERRIDVAGAATTPCCAEGRLPVPLQQSCTEGGEADQGAEAATENALHALIDDAAEAAGDCVDVSDSTTYTHTHAVVRHTPPPTTPLNGITGPSLHLPSDAQLESVSCVAYPVLVGLAGVRRDAPAADGLEGASRMCAVCELDGIVAAADGYTEDRLVACATCRSLVHAHCACTREADEVTLNFCCTHCAKVP